MSQSLMKFEARIQMRYWNLHYRIWKSAHKNQNDGDDHDYDYDDDYGDGDGDDDEDCEDGASDDDDDTACHMIPRSLMRFEARR